MRPIGILIALALAGCGGSSRSDGGASGDLEPALEACVRGDLDQADALLRDRKDYDSIRFRARILMMKNQNRQAIEILRPLDPRAARKAKTYTEMEGQHQVLPDLGLAYVRQDDFLNAAQIYSMMGEPVAARQYESLSRSVAYLSNVGEGGTSIDFHVTEPVPVVAGTVNGFRALFAIDTMLDEVMIDRTLARRAGLQILGQSGAGSYGESVVPEIGVGDITVKNVPVRLGDLIRLGRLQVDGVIGLQFLMHFDFTIDYRRSRLTLRKAGGTIQGAPAYRLGDRYLLAGGTLNGKDRIYVAIGTALKGVTVAASQLFVESLSGGVRELAAGPIRIEKPELDLKAFPEGLDGSFGIPVGFVLGHAALRGHALRVEPRAMKIAID